ncbi:hypothetical protein GCM10009744_46550 [Kribbella alba]|uniref:DUF4288 domain-containing protein n=1 Tax=Kribbella alba TaxID=190197 RepID=A0ABN2FJD5_9ACTN
MGWYSVRCVFQHLEGRADDSPYEERILLWEAPSFDAAIELAEEEAAEYAADIDAVYLGLAQSFFLGADMTAVGSGTEVYSLIRGSDLAPDAYLDAFFDTGAEYQREVGQT